MNGRATFPRSMWRLSQFSQINPERLLGRDMWPSLLVFINTKVGYMTQKAGDGQSGGKLRMKRNASDDKEGRLGRPRMVLENVL